MKRFTSVTLIIALLALLIAVAPIAAQDAPKPVTLTLVGYAVPREAYGAIIPLFQAKWQKEKKQQVLFLESYGASGSQSRAIAGGFEADIAALSIEPDITRLADAKLITHDWKKNDYNGFVTDSLVVLAVRTGNPKNIKDWADLGQDGLEIITPDPATSGGAQWNILAAYGAAQRGKVAGFDAADGPDNLLKALAKNISVLDKDGRESFLTFERGIGDVAITYENEIYAGKIKGGEYDTIYPTSTILIENPVALIDTYVDKHGTREVAEAFIQFLYSPEAQTAFAQNGFRPVNKDVAKQFKVNEAPSADSKDPITFPPVKDQFTIEQFGGWSKARAALFGDKGLFTKILAEAKGS
jgi:sulfate transport system substrate-binding protein